MYNMIMLSYNRNPKMMINEMRFFIENCSKIMRTKDWNMKIKDIDFKKGQILKTKNLLNNQINYFLIFEYGNTYQFVELFRGNVVLRYNSIKGDEIIEIFGIL